VTVGHRPVPIGHIPAQARAIVAVATCAATQVMRIGRRRVVPVGPNPARGRHIGENVISPEGSLDYVSVLKTPLSYQHHIPIPPSPSCSRIREWEMVCPIMLPSKRLEHGRAEQWMWL
jgi:hypothetical protein